MSENQDTETTDVEGHGRRYIDAPDETDEDTEGHAGRFKGAAPEGDDTEGHATRAKV